MAMISMTREERTNYIHNLTNATSYSNYIQYNMQVRVCTYLH